LGCWLDALLCIKTYLSFENKCCKDFTVTQNYSIYVIRKKCLTMLSRKKKMLLKIWNCITSMNLTSCKTISILYLLFFCFFVTRSGFCCEDRLATLPLGLVAPTLLDACLPVSNLLATRTQWKIDEMVMNRLSTFPALRNSRRQKSSKNLHLFDAFFLHNSIQFLGWQIQILLSWN